MRKSLALFALIAIPLTACGSGTTTPAAPSTTTSAAVSSSGASNTEAMTEAMSSAADSSGAMASGAMASGAMAESSGSMMDDSGSAMMTEDSMHPASEAMTAEMPPAGGAPGITIATADSDYGQVLFDGTGQAIYLFGKETTPVPDCYGDCAAAWPPVLAEGSPVAGTGTMADLLGTAPRTDGSIQVTYAGHPLYYYAHEGKNVVTCHNVSEFGGLWLAVTPTGQPAA